MAEDKQAKDLVYKAQLEQGKKFANAFTILVGAAVIWFSGFITYGFSKGSLFYPEPYGSLYNKKTELVRKIDEWNRFIPLMKESLVSQYKDRLENAVRDTSEINLKMDKIKQEQDKRSEKAYWSWLAYFMD